VRFDAAARKAWRSSMLRFASQACGGTAEQNAAHHAHGKKRRCGIQRHRLSRFVVVLGLRMGRQRYRNLTHWYSSQSIRAPGSRSGEMSDQPGCR